MRVYAVWFNMLASDDRSRWPEDLLTDPRVVHFWDQPKNLGRFYLRHFELEDDYQAEALWDAYILYDADARWESEPSRPVSWGFTIVRTRQDLDRDLRRLLAQPVTTE